MSASSRSTAKVNAKDVFRNLKWRCTHCGKELKVIEVVLFGKPTEVPCWGSCGCEESKWDGTNVDREDRKFARAGIPERYIKAECDLEGAQLAVSGGRSLYIHGAFGTGKTAFACCLAKALVNMGHSVRFENSRHLMSEIQGIYDGRRTDALERAYGCDVLVLDDLGKEQATAYSISMLYEIVDMRYQEAKPIVVTSNFSRDRLLQRWAQADAETAESIVSRLCDGTDVVVMDGEDRRLA